MRRPLLLSALALAALAGGGWAAARTADPSDAAALLLAKRQAEEAEQRSRRLERESAEATSEAARARAESQALVARIQAAEADITAAETRIRIIEELRAKQRARLAVRQEPVVRLTAALQTMARRPPALALVQPGSLEDLIHVRSLLASTLPVIRERTSSVREEIARGDELKRQAEVAVTALERSRFELHKQRVALARLEADQRARSRQLAESAMFESDRALALGENARVLDELFETRERQAEVRAQLAALPGPVLRPRPPGQVTPVLARGEPRDPPYILPVEGRLLTGMGEISDAGVHARGLTFRTRSGVEVVAPRGGRIAYSGRFRGYGEIVIIDHGGGWTSLITGLGAVAVEVGDSVRKDQAIGRAERTARPSVTVELRRNGRPRPITPLIATG